MIFWHAPSGDVRARELFSEDFGAAGAVWCCNRVFKALVLVLQYFFLLPNDHYFDDYWIFSAPWSMQSASFVLDRAIEVLGYHWEKNTIHICRFPCWVCPSMLSTAGQFVKIRENESNTLSRSFSLESLRLQMNSISILLLASSSLRTKVCADALDSTLDARFTKL